jgi:hypothetical protein
VQGASIEQILTDSENKRNQKNQNNQRADLWDYAL